MIILSTARGKGCFQLVSEYGASIVKNMLVEENLDQIKKVVTEIIKTLAKRMGSLETGQDGLKKDIRKIDKKLDFVSAVFDDEFTRVRTKPFNIETKLHLEN